MIFEQYLNFLFPPPFFLSFSFNSLGCWNHVRNWSSQRSPNQPPETIRSQSREGIGLVAGVSFLVSLSIPLLAQLTSFFSLLLTITVLEMFPCLSIEVKILWLKIQKNIIDFYSISHLRLFASQLDLHILSFPTNRLQQRSMLFLFLAFTTRFFPYV